jgi:hypothetical protein
MSLSGRVDMHGGNLTRPTISVGFMGPKSKTAGPFAAGGFVSKRQ